MRNAWRRKKMVYQGQETHDWWLNHLVSALICLFFPFDSCISYRFVNRFAIWIQNVFIKVIFCSSWRLMFLLVLFCRHSRKDEGLPTCWIELAYKIIWEWYKWNPCWWNGMYKKDMVFDITLVFLFYEFYFVESGDCVFMLLYVSSDFYLFLQSRALVKPYKQSPY